MANKAIVYAIYPNKEQEIQCRKTFGCCRFVYNQMLTIQQERHKKKEKHFSKTDANDYCNQQLKKEYPFLKEVDKFALTNAIYHLESAYSRFFQHISRFPKYKSRHRSRKAYTTNFTNGNIEVGEGFVKLPKLGKVKAKIHRLPGDDWKLKSATVAQNGDGSFQVSVLFEYEESVAQVCITEETSIGLDYKSDGLYEDSNGNTCDMPHYYRKSEKRLAKAQRKLSRKVIGSRNYEKQKKRVGKIHRHAANQRKDFLQKQSTAITKQYHCVCVENLDLKAMSNQGFGNGKATMDNGYGMFLNMLEYKLKDKGGKLVKVDKWFASSQICSCCGVVHPEMKDLSERTMRCECGNVMGRDHNAAVNVKKEGLRLLFA